MANHFSTANLRKLWLDFFKQHNHYVIGPYSLIPVDDDSLLWINSGMATLKPFFEGRAEPPHPNLVNVQKVIRTNDIEHVGKTNRHNTLFEMIGNFSIGGYFKQKAIQLAWEFLTNSKWLGLDPEKIYITVYEKDDDSYWFWTQEHNVKSDHIFQLGRKTNFWEIGAGPCGPNTEIFYDRGPEFDPKVSGPEVIAADLENNRYLEIWNIVFSEFKNDGEGNYTELPTKNIDTGAGLERLACVLQSVSTNFETDGFQIIIQALENLGTKPYQVLNRETMTAYEQSISIAYRIVADHLRAVIMALADGILPSNKDRGYILRRLIRRAIIQARVIGIKKSFLINMIEHVIKSFFGFYPEIERNQESIMESLKVEEEIFNHTLKIGEAAFEKLLTTHCDSLQPKDLFRLYSTWGLPWKIMVNDPRVQAANIKYDDLLLLESKHRAQSQKTRKSRSGFTPNNPLLLNFKKHCAIEYYNHDRIPEAKITLIYKNDTNFNTITNTSGYIALDRTPFYAEKGGQAGDRGLMMGSNGVAEVCDVKIAPHGQYIHAVNVKGTLNKDDIVIAEVDPEVRRLTRKNHSGTHLLHAAIREILGKTAYQIGSFNNDQNLRIDINCIEKINPAKIKAIETRTLQAINMNYKTEIIWTNYENAINNYHALAFFNEKYNKEVRIVKFGNFSVELCGGTHCSSSREVEDLLITHIESKGQNSYRFYALTSSKAIKNFLETEILNILKEIQEITTLYELNKSKLKNQELANILDEFQSLKPNRQEWRRGLLLKPQIIKLYKQYTKQLATLDIQAQIKSIVKVMPFKVSKLQIVLQQLNQTKPLLLKSLVDFYSQQSNINCVFVYSQLVHHRYQFAVRCQNSNKLSSQVIVQEFLKNIDPNLRGGANKYFGQGIFNFEGDSKGFKQKLVTFVKKWKIKNI